MKIHETIGSFLSTKIHWSFAIENLKGKWIQSYANLKYAPKHFRIGTRDYIAMVENSGNYLLNRRGNVRIKTPNDLILF